MTEISYSHFCALGALCNPNCSTRFDKHLGATRYYYYGNVSTACWMGYNK